MMRSLAYRALGRFPGTIPYVAPLLKKVVHRSRPVLRPRGTLDEITSAELIRRLEDRLSLLDVETSNVCNARCPFCAYKFRTKPPRIMSIPEFIVVLQKLEEYGSMDLSFTPLVGDPLTDRTLVHKIRIARENEQVRTIGFATNLIGLTRHNVRDVLLSGLNSIIVSTSIGSREMFKRVYGVDRYDRALNNLISLLVTNIELGKPIKIGIHLKCEKPFHQVYSSSDYQRIVKLYGSYIPIADDKDYMNWTGLIGQDSVPRGIRLEDVGDQSEPCEQLYTGLQVYSDGTVGACRCVDVNAALAVGDIFHESLSEIWHGQRLTSFRKEWKAGNIPLLCKGCTMYAPLSGLLQRQISH